ncbi:MAG: T9SS type A sorting domain-containing protein [Flavobacteriales bacterium]|jgi:hypothetical protein|nr:T9SS type A sorting domain-containing protein [Flavobacteriales bacterium]
MRLGHLLSMLPLLFSATLVNAQITEVATMSGRFSSVQSLELAGPKFIQLTQTGFQLFDPDLTPFQQAVYPTIPAGCTMFSLTIPSYITESLFDQDPSSIEYMFIVQCAPADSTSASNTGTVVARMDGTILLMDTMFGPSGWNGPDQFSSTSTIFNTPLGPRLVLGQGYGATSRIYALPGTLPCIACDGGIGMQVAPGDERIAEVSLFPNPGTDIIDLRIKGGGGYLLSLHDATGRSVRKFGLVSGEEIEFSVEGLQSGYYQVVLTDAMGRIFKTLPLIVD